MSLTLDLVLIKNVLVLMYESAHCTWGVGVPGLDQEEVEFAGAWYLKQRTLVHVSPSHRFFVFSSVSDIAGVTWFQWKWTDYLIYLLSLFFDKLYV